MSRARKIEDSGPLDPLIDASKDYYREFGVEPTATPAEIEQRHAKILEESRNAASPPSFEELANIIAAYSVLSDPARRAKYDLARLGGTQQAVETLSSSGRSPYAREYLDQTIRQREPMSMLSFYVIGLVLLVLGAISSFTSLELIYVQR